MKVKTRNKPSLNSTNERPVRLGIVGCGYVTARSHLPASRLVDLVDVVALVDIHSERAQELAREYQIPILTSNHKTIYDEVDAVIIAVPHHHHTQIALDFINQGIHVLVEKPMGTSVEECKRMVSAANSSNVKLAVGHMRRFFDNTRLVKRIVESGTFGDVQRFHAEEAVLFDKFNASPFTVFPPAGGVLYDTGTHILDLILWWLGDFKDIQYWDDRIAGVEANCHIEITTSSGVSGRVELSRTRNLENKVKFVCQEGELELSTLNPTQLTIHSTLFSGPLRASKVVPEMEIRHLVPYFAEQLLDFALAIAEDRQPFVTGNEGMRNIAVIEHCRQNRQPLEVQPWAHPDEHIIQRISS